MNLHEYTTAEIIFVFGSLWLSGVFAGLAIQKQLSRLETAHSKTHTASLRCTGQAKPSASLAINKGRVAR